MRIEDVTLLTILEGQKDADGFDTGGEAIETELSATEMSVKVSDRIAGEHEGWKVSLKIAVDIDDYETAFIMESSSLDVGITACSSPSQKSKIKLSHCEPHVVCHC